MPRCFGAFGAQTLPASIPTVSPVLRCLRDKHLLCVKCLGMQHASSTLGYEMFCSICAESQPWTLHRSLAEFTRVASSASSAELSTALGAPPSPLPLFHLPSSPSHSVPGAQASAHRAHSCSRSPLGSSKRARHSRQFKDILDLNSQMAEVLEYLVRQQALPSASAPAPPPAPAPILTPPSPAVADVSDRGEAMSEEDQDVISIVASWDGDSLEQQETEAQEVTQETGPGSEVASETGVTLPSSLV
ncbi:UNVERIFIED_CONTAM: hypothetical protein FKN15_046716 [Acipenser sinensis]